MKELERRIDELEETIQEMKDRGGRTHREIDADLAKAARDAIEDFMIWGESDEGHDFWDDIHTRLDIYFTEANQ